MTMVSKFNRRDISKTNYVPITFLTTLSEIHQLQNDKCIVSRSDLPLLHRLIPITQHIMIVKFSSHLDQNLVILMFPLTPSWPFYYENRCYRRWLHVFGLGCSTIWQMNLSGLKTLTLSCGPFSPVFRIPSTRKKWFGNSSLRILK